MSRNYRAGRPEKKAKKTIKDADGNERKHGYSTAARVIAILVCLAFVVTTFTMAVAYII